MNQMDFLSGGAAALLAGAAIGLVRACETNLKTPDTDALLLRALTALAQNADADSFAALTEQLHIEKTRVSPGCAVCTARCGNTDDYDLALLAGASFEIRAAKLRILAGCCRLAALAYPSTDSVFAGSAVPLIEKALGMLPYDLEESRLLDAAQKAEQACLLSDI